MKFKCTKEWNGELSAFFRGNRKQILLICAVIFLVAGLQLTESMKKSQNYIIDSDGSLIAVQTKGIEGSISLPMTITAEKDGVKTKLDVTLILNNRSEVKQEKKVLQEDPQVLLRDTVEKAIKDLQEQEGELIKLPNSLKDGTKLSWLPGKSSSLLAVLLLLPLSVAALYQNQKQKRKEQIKRKLDGIRKELPGFNDQLLLLLNSGMIFHDAFMQIAEGFAEKAAPGYLGEIVVQISRKSTETESSLVTLMGQYSKKLGIIEFSRLANILEDHQYKGVNLTEKLESESVLLWTQRKKLAEEKGKAAETKLTFPLALLLLVLIVMTASPAMLQM